MVYLLRGTCVAESDRTLHQYPTKAMAEKDDRPANGSR